MRPIAAWFLVSISAAGVAVSPAALSQQSSRPKPFSVVEASITDLQGAMGQGVITSREVTAQYLDRIARYNTRFRAAITTNPRALDEAADRDRERRQGRVRGPLHGIPIALKDNIHTRDMPTTGGALVFAGLKPPYEATLARRLREAGAVILAKTTMTELANWVSTSMPPGYNAALGFSLNPYDPRPSAGGDGGPMMSPGGSSSGVGTSASLWAANVGTETSGSILNPANQTLLVGIKPTVGRVSRHGVIPISSDQDTPGPMARTVSDAAILLAAMAAGGPDPNDPATRACVTPLSNDSYARALRRDGLQGARIGIPRASFYERANIPVRRSALLGDEQRRSMTEAIDALRAAGATVVDPADLPSLTSVEPARNILNWPICIGQDVGGGNGLEPIRAPRNPACSVVLSYGMKRDFNRWLASLGTAAPVKTLSELREWNRAHERDGALRFGQNQLDAAARLDLEAVRPRYEADRARDLELAGRDGIDAALRANRLDALAFPAFYAASIAARAGYPTVIVPFAPPTSTTLPLGVSFTGPACSEPRLIEIAYAFEQATRRRIAPRLD